MSGADQGHPLRKIVQVAVSADPTRGGVFTAVECFAQALRPWCHHTIVNFSEVASGVESDRVHLRIASGVLGRRFGRVGAAERSRGLAALSGADFVIIHVPYRYHASWAAAWCRRNRIPYVFVAHGAFDPYVFTYRAWQKRLWVRLIGRRLLQQASMVIYATQGEAEKAVREVGAYPSLVLPFPTAIPPMAPRGAARSAVGKWLGTREDQRILVFLGRLHEIKRPEETVQAFAAVAPRGWVLVVAGPDDGVTVRQLAAAGGAGTEVRLVGPLFGEQKAQLLSAADALVLFSRKENLGFVVLEALAQGVPVGISDELDLAAEVVARGCGWVGDGRTASGREAVLRAMCTATSDERTARGALGRAWVASEMTAERFAERLRSSIEGVIGLKGRCESGTP